MFLTTLRRQRFVRRDVTAWHILGQARTIGRERQRSACDVGRPCAVHRIVSPPPEISQSSITPERPHRFVHSASLRSATCKQSFELGIFLFYPKAREVELPTIQVNAGRSRETE